jgi:hypothetical protein
MFYRIFNCVSPSNSQHLMPKPRKPTSQLGEQTLAKNKGRYAARAREPRPAAKLGAPPKDLTPAQKKLWREIVAQVPPGVLTSADRIIVEITVRQLEKLRTGLASPVDIGHLRQSLASLGMTPADRSRVSTAPEAPPQDDPYGFLG